jgi:hypothetical protein
LNATSADGKRGGLAITGWPDDDLKNNIDDNLKIEKY